MITCTCEYVSAYNQLFVTLNKIINCMTQFNLVRYHRQYEYVMQFIDYRSFYSNNIHYRVYKSKNTYFNYTFAV